MLRPSAPVSLADLSAAGIRLRPYEAATIVRALALQVARGDVAGVPSPHVIRLSAAGGVSVEGPVEAGGRPVVRAAQLLELLLPTSDAGGEFRVPGGLKLIVARALGTLDLPPFASLDSFAEALSRFAAPDPESTVANLVARGAALAAAAASEPSEAGIEPLPQPAGQIQRFVTTRDQQPRGTLPVEALTVSDIRRARRATGIPLSVVAERSRIPIALLRQLEWGYLLEWPSGRYGRTQLVRYAKATGLDEQLVAATVWPLIEQAETLRALFARKSPAPEPSAEPVSPPVLYPEPTLAGQYAIRASGTQERREATGRRSRALALLAIPAMLALGFLPVSSERWSAWGEQLASVAGTISHRVAGVAGRDQVGTKAPAGPEELRPEETASEPDVAASAPRSAVPDNGAPPVGEGGPQATTGRGEEPAGEQQGDRSGDVPDPARRAPVDALAYSPSSSAVQTAMFYDPPTEGRTALVSTNSGSYDSVLRITRIVDDTARNFHVRISPDGGRIAFDSDRDGERGVYVADADGKNVRRVSGGGFAAIPSWSPDGKTLAFVREEAERPQVWNLWTVDLDTGELRQVTRLREGRPWGGSWFPDGRRIAYGRGDRLVIRDLQTGRERVFPSPRKGRLVRTPTVSPDGRRVIFKLTDQGTWLLEMADGSMRPILEDPTAEEYAWSSDGQRIAYYSARSGGWGVWVMAPR